MYNLDRNTPRWTQTARECYEIGCRCSNCLLYIVLGGRCRMKEAVFELVRKFGAPAKEDESIFTKYEQRVLNAIKNGCNTLAEIAVDLNKSESAISGIVHLLYTKARTLGWNPIKKGIVTKSLLPQFIEWVRGEYDNV